MRLLINSFLTKSSKEYPPLIDKVGIQESILEDVQSFEFSENGIQVYFNDKTFKFIELRDNDGEDSGDWRGVSIFIERKFLKVDL